VPNRILKESTLTSPNLNECSIYAQDLFKRILVMVDDYGCCEGNIPIIYGRAYSMCMDRVTINDVKKWRQELIDNKLIEIWKEDKREYISISNSEKHLFSKKCYTDEGKPTRHRRKTPEPPERTEQKESQQEPERANTEKEVPNPNPNPNPNPKPKDKVSPITCNVTEIINYLNEKVGTNYRPTTESTRKLIKARLKEGNDIDAFKWVIDVKYEEWKGKHTKDGKDMEDFLRPQTLFSNKFEGYLNQSKKEKPE
jgi:uncharacterized phage protein (TIGR02220 family)